MDPIFGGSCMHNFHKSRQYKFNLIIILKSRYYYDFHFIVIETQRLSDFPKVKRGQTQGLKNLE